MPTDTDTEWATPTLRQFKLEMFGQMSGYSSGKEDHWFVSQSSVAVGKVTKLPIKVRYLHRDGSWRYGMDTGKEHVGTGGTYFATLEEVIEVLCQHEIDVVGLD